MKYTCKYLFSLAAFAILACQGGTPKEIKQDVAPDSVAISSKRPIYDRLLAELDSNEIYQDTILYGYWFKPHEACAVNIFFHKDGTYEFKYYIVENETTIVDVVKKGSFIVGSPDANQTRYITLNNADGWGDSNFRGVIKYSKINSRFCLTDEKSNLYLVKGSD